MSVDPVPENLDTFRSFWPYYVREHSHPVSRKLHVGGTLASLLILPVALAMRSWEVTLAMPVCGYGAAWIGHFFFEKNRPATFKYPFYSLAGDFYMLYKTLSGTMPDELRKYSRLTEPTGRAGQGPV